MGYYKMKTEITTRSSEVLWHRCGRLVTERGGTQLEGHHSSADLQQQLLFPCSVQYPRPGRHSSARSFSQQILGLLPALHSPSVSLLNLNRDPKAESNNQSPTATQQLRPTRVVRVFKAVRKWTHKITRVKKKFLITLNYGAVVFILIFSIALSRKGEYKTAEF